MFVGNFWHAKHVEIEILRLLIWARLLAWIRKGSSNEKGFHMYVYCTYCFQIEKYNIRRGKCEQ